MDISHPTSRTFDRISFAMLMPDQIRRLSVKLISNPTIFDHLNHPVKGGLYDPALGPIDKNARCATCGLSAFQCPGHFGHIELPVPVYCPLTFGQMYSILKLTCLYCHRLRMGPVRVAMYTAKLQLLDAQLLLEAIELDNIVAQRSFIDQEQKEHRTVANDEASILSKLVSHVQECLQKATERPRHKIGAVAEYRRRTINEFMRKTNTTNICHYCRGHSPSLHRHNNAKIFQLPLRKNLQSAMMAKGMNAQSLFDDAVEEKDEPIPTDSRRSSGMMEEELDDNSDNELSPEAHGSAFKPTKGRPATKTQANYHEANQLETRGMQYLTPMHIYEHLKRLWENERIVLNLIFDNGENRSKNLNHRRGTSAAFSVTPINQSTATRSEVDERIFFTQVISVPPCRFRPPSVFGDSQFDHPQNTYLSEILKLCQGIIEIRNEMNLGAEKGINQTDKQKNISIEDKAEEGPMFAKLVSSWIQLQEKVNYFFDSSKNTSGGSTSGGMGKLAPAGIKQILEKKEGLFRKHMMGKRVNFAARSVISPDVMLETNQIGVPMVFAKKLTYPEPVTAYNVESLRKAVLNGPEVHPGATHVQMEDGTLAALEHLTEEARIQLASQLSDGLADGQYTVANSPTGMSIASPTFLGSSGKKVLRHIKDGDVVLMNRQPTLHKPSMMTHKVRILEGEKTLRMHYANCDAYNADFDGDEMNLHFPQNELARAEAYTISNTDKQYIVPTDGSPLRGLIQDHVVTGVLMTLKDAFLDRQAYQQLIWGSLPDNGRRIITISPAIIKPKALWTGKQLITTVLINLAQGRSLINLKCDGKLKKELWGKDHADETKVIIDNGYFATGILDKNQIGASSYGLVHAVYELYGPETAGQLLSTLGRLLTKFDQHFGFTCRMDDLLLTDSAEAARANLIAKSHSLGRKIVAEYAEVSSTDLPNLRLNSEKMLRSDDLLRGLDGAFKGKMNAVTSEIISACLPHGQLIKFPKNNMTLMTASGAKGSVVNFSQISGLLGQQELEGRRVPIMVSGKSLPSFPPFDTRARAGGYISQRFFSGIRPQEFFFHCMAGREGLIDTTVKTSRSGYLQRCLIKHLESLRVHYDNTVRDSDGSIVQFYYGEDGLDVVKAGYLDKFDFCWNNFGGLIDQCKPTFILDKIDRKEAVGLAKKAWKKPHRYEPVMAKFSPSAHLGAVSDKFYSNLEAFIKEQDEQQLKHDKGIQQLSTATSKARGETSNSLEDKNSLQFRALMWLKYMKSLVEPGEAVGLLAAQSIGEPSTQMTLNTFHFAGFGAKNVTLGIPRLREIIMTASAKIKTPTMSIAMKPDASGECEKLCGLLGRLILKQLMRKVYVCEKLVKASDLPPAAVTIGKRARVYSVVIDLEDLDTISQKYSLDISLVKSSIENGFVSKLMAHIEKTIKKMRSTSGSGNKDLIGSIAISKTSTVTEGTGEEGGEHVDEDMGHAEPRGRKGSPKEDAEFGSDEEELDASEAKLASKRKEIATYDEEDKEDETFGGEGDGESETEFNEVHQQHAKETELVSTQTFENGTTLAECRCIRNYKFEGAGIHPKVSFDLIFPSTSPKILLLDMIEKVSGEVIVRQVPGLVKCHPQMGEKVTEAGQTPTSIITEGVNLLGLWEYGNQLDLNSIYSNDIYAILHAFGVEAARATIVREISAVFQVYGISVDSRHLALIADWMTHEGEYKPFNRMGIDSSPSPLLKMTFETTVSFLRSAALYADSDDLICPSARLVLGLPVNLGTGSFELRYPLTAESG